MAEPIDTDAFRKRHHPVNPVRYDGDTDGLVTDGPAVCPRCATQGWPCDASRLADEVDRLRAENAALAAALEDIAGMVLRDRWVADATCAGMNHVCHHRYPDDPGEWCPVCVAEICWCAWKMGVLR